MAKITALNVYPVKSCRGASTERARVTDTGLEHDREWLIVRPDGRFITQREEPLLALIETEISSTQLSLNTADAGSLTIPLDAAGTQVEVICWQDKCAAFDAGDVAADWLSSFLKKTVRLVRFDRRSKRASATSYTGGAEVLNQFSDAFPWLLISQASLDDLNSRLPAPLPMNRFRPNIVVDGLPAYGEDTVCEFVIDGVRLKPVKACARCVITTTNQFTAEREGDEPLRTLRQYRFDRESKGVLFDQNLMTTAGVGRELRVGQEVEVI